MCGARYAESPAPLGSGGHAAHRKLGSAPVGKAEGFVNLIDGVVTSVESVRPPLPVCWFLARAPLLDIDASGRRGVELPKVKSTYWPHRINFERLGRSRLDWRLLCPGPMVEQPALNLDQLRSSLDAVPRRWRVRCRARCFCKSSLR